MRTFRQISDNSARAYFDPRLGFDAEVTERHTMGGYLCVAGIE